METESKIKNMTDRSCTTAESVKNRIVELNGAKTKDDPKKLSFKLMQTDR